MEPTTPSSAESISPEPKLTPQDIDAIELIMRQGNLSTSQKGKSILGSSTVDAIAFWLIKKRVVTNKASGRAIIFATTAIIFVIILAGTIFSWYSNSTAQSGLIRIKPLQGYVPASLAH